VNGGRVPPRSRVAEQHALASATECERGGQAGRAVVPGFVRSVLANDPDVVQLFAALLAATRDEVAHWLVEQVGLLEERFAS
jgi:hypothetical protein